ncbi:hypothetical protein B566_EDAN011349 [Ephemera danica]|nr:hypothetical protein B566_EDAN011349 [Ephemera danica]
MKLLLVVVAVTLVAGGRAASLTPRDEAVELLLETAQFDEKLQEKRELDNNAEKRSYSPNGAYGGYEPNFEYHEPQVPPYPAKAAAPAFDLWGFKSAILNALYQAVKAVAGGSIAVKGQLIRGGGNLLQAQGRLIASGGQAVSSFGRSVAHSALHSAPVLPSLHKAKFGVASAVGNVVAGAAGAVGSAVAGAAGAVAGAVSGAADAVSSHVAHKFTPSQQSYLPPAPIAYKPSSGGYQAGLLVVKPISVAEPQHAPARPVDTAATYGGSLDESFGTSDLGYNAYGGQNTYNGDFNIQPSISYDLHYRLGTYVKVIIRGSNVNFSLKSECVRDVISVVAIVSGQRSQRKAYRFLFPKFRIKSNFQKNDRVSSLMLLHRCIIQCT